MRREGLTPALGLLTLVLGGCASLPADPVERGLYLDLRRSVELSEDTQWIADETEIRDSLEDALRSVCQVEPIHRKNLRAWLNAQLLLEGGSPEQIYLDNGRDLDAADDALTLDRVRLLLSRADGMAGADCPFWLEPSDDFRGVQGGGYRPLLWLETIGGGRAILEKGKDLGLGGGGGGRILGGWAFNHRLSLVGGVEVGGGGLVVDRQGGSGQTIETAFTGAVPLVLRVQAASRVLDLEAAVVFPVLDDGDKPLGFRANVGIGLGTMRKSVFLPYGLIVVGYEVYPSKGDGPMSHVLFAGSRVGVDWLL